MQVINLSMAFHQAAAEKRPTVQAVTSTRTYVHCPHCGERDSTIDHIGLGEGQTTSFGPWYCDKCGGSYTGQVDPVSGSLELTLQDEKKIETRDLVMLPANLPHPVYMVLEGMRFSSHEKEGKDPNDQTYFYESHSCPTNWIPKIDKLIYNGDTDPHGLIKFVKGVDVEKMAVEGIEPDDIHQQLDDPEFLQKHFPETVVHPQFLVIFRTLMLESEAKVDEWFHSKNPSTVVKMAYGDMMFKFAETLVDEGKFGDKWMTDVYLSHSAVVQGEKRSQLRVVAFPKDVRKRTDADGHKVFVMTDAVIVLDEADAIKEFRVNPEFYRSGELKD